VTGTESSPGLAASRVASLAWRCAAAAALAGALNAPVRAEHGDPPRGLGRDERTALLARSWRAQSAVAQGAGGDAPRLLLEPGIAGRTSLRWRLDASSSLSIRLRREQVSLTLRHQF
jgi:hypothetical protein